MFENINKLLNISEKLGTPAMQLIIHHRGKEIFNECRGVSDEIGTLFTGRELMNLYSCSKFVTCVAALKLYEEGKFSLEDDVADYISAFGDMTVKKSGGVFKAENRIKIKHLFTMTSGLNYQIKSREINLGVKETDGECPTVKMMEYIAKMPLKFEPGESWNYGLSHDVLAAVVEIVSGKRFGEYVDEVIFKPIGMKDSTFSLPSEKLSSVCEQYLYIDTTKEYKNIGKKIAGYKLGSKYESGGAGCVSTAADYIKFLDAVKERKLLSDDTVRLMTKNHLTQKQLEALLAPDAYGYGLGVRVPLGDGKRTDYGWGGAAGAIAAIDEIHDITLYYSQHVCTSPFAPIRKDFTEAVKLDLGFDAFREDMGNRKGNYLA